jgi:hypothetical protein
MLRVKKTALALLIFTFLISFILPSFAEYREDRDYFAGEIIAVNVKENKITIYDYMHEAKRTFFIENGVGSDLKPGVEVMVSVLKGTNTAKKVKLVIPRSKQL